jgi:prephenate dehydrogenase
MGLLGGSITLSVLRSFGGVKVVGYSHRASTRRKARELAVAGEIADDICSSVSRADLVILSTPIYTFAEIFGEISGALPAGCIVTDVGSTKQLPHRWAAKLLPKGVHYVGSHPIAGSEQRGIEFARDDLFERAMCVLMCVLTTTAKSNASAVKCLKKFWSKLGCSVKTMRPGEHDRIFGCVSHLPHITAASLINANTDVMLKYAGKGFIDTSRIASGPVNIWADILLTNTKNSIQGIDRIIAELVKVKKALKSQDRKKVERLLERAREKRAAMMKYKIKRKELLQ